MALVRCREHGQPRGRTYTYHPQPKEPDGNSLVCGIPGCVNQGVGWLTEDEERQYSQLNQRIIALPNSNATKIRVR